MCKWEHYSNPYSSPVKSSLVTGQTLLIPLFLGDQAEHNRKCQSQPISLVEEFNGKYAVTESLTNRVQLLKSLLGVFYS